VALIHGIRTFLAAKAVPVAAATLVIGGGAAIAAPGVVTLSGDDGVETAEAEEEHDWAIGRADDEQLDRIADFCDEEPDAAFCRGDSYGHDEMQDRAPASAGDPEKADVNKDDAEDGRSDTARRVHEALSGDEAIVPGDRGFGQAVSERARTGQLGGLVSRVARGDVVDDDDFDLDERSEPGPPEHARGGSASDDDDAQTTVTTQAEPKAEPKAERPGPPAAASRSNSGNSGNSGPQNRGGPGR